MKKLKKAKDLATLYSLLEKYKPEELEICYMIDVDGDDLIRYVYRGDQQCCRGGNRPETTRKLRIFWLNNW